jgi:hypothetical protein
MKDPASPVEIDALWEQIRTYRQERYVDFESLMPFRVRNILLVASVYDSFTLEEAGRLTELILTEFRDLNISQSPLMSRATSGDEALALIDRRDFDLVIAMTRIGETKVVDFARRTKMLRPDLPVIVLGYNMRELEQLIEVADSPIDRIFIWTGEVKLLVAIIKHIEDLKNVEHDTRTAKVRTIILIEDSIRFYSAYMPLIYTEVVRQTLGLMHESINLSQKLLRLRARPKILFATTFEEAWAFYDKYRDYMLGAICDARFPWGGRLRHDAGFEFIRRMKDDDPQMPAALQSFELKNEGRAAALGAAFIRKDSPSLLEDLRKFMRRNFGFGNFVFRLPDGTEVGRAHNTKTLIQEMARVPDESLEFHASHDHFSNWLRARTKFTLANRIKPVKATQFESVAELRQYLIDVFITHQEHSLKGTIADFSEGTFDVSSGFTRIGTGSLGGKARGLAFLNHLVTRYDIQAHFPGTEIKVPPTAVVATDVFDEFLDQGDLREFAINEADDAKIVEAFLAAKLPRATVRELRYLLRQVKVPLAIRSSSLLEDAQYQPFAGVYNTYMIPNNHPKLARRLDQLSDAVKLVYASTFFQSAKAYLTATSNRVEEEKMAVIVQQVVGRSHDHFVYPSFAGAAQSTDHYAHGDADPEDGVALVALGLGRIVVEGGRCIRFSPKAPQRLWQFSTIKDALKLSQRRFLALDVSDPEAYPALRDQEGVVWLELEDAEKHGTLEPVGSVYSPENDAIYDGIHRPGPRVVTFAHVLKSEVFPLAGVLSFLLELGRRCMSCPIEIEFAANMHDDTRPNEFCLLQIRPLTADRLPEKLDLDAFTKDETLVTTEVALGNGHYDNILDIVCVDRTKFDRTVTPAIAREISEMNRELMAAGRPYLLVGPGRWGSADRWLGIPVQWADISGASVIVESDLSDFKVTPSQGTHFFQNLTSFQVGYLTVNQTSGGGHLNWPWLEQQPAAKETRYLRHLRFADPITVLIDGRSGRGVVAKPGRILDPERTT